MFNLLSASNSIFEHVSGAMPHNYTLGVFLTPIGLFSTTKNQYPKVGSFSKAKNPMSSHKNSVLHPNVMYYYI